MAISSPYIADVQFESVLADLNISDKSGTQKQEIVDRAEGELEGGLVARYVVPLQADGGGAFSTVPKFTRSLVLSAMKAAIRKVIGDDNARNVIVENTQRFVDVHKSVFKGSIEALTDPKKIYGLQMQSQAEGAVDPVQSVGLGRANNDLFVELDQDVF